MRVVAALGGNALARRGEPLDAERQRRRVSSAADALARVAREHDLVVTHGNGPQVGWLALQAEAGGAARPLDVLDAETEGMIGYWIEQELGNRLPGREVAALLTRVRVDAGDPAFAAPTKPIGPVHPEARARALAASRGWSVAADAGGFRRVVPSPEPLEILEARALEILVGAGVVVVCAGGGGIPVVRGPDGGLRGVEAVIDKDLAAALLARRLDADALLLLTDVPAVYLDWPEPAQRPLHRATPAQLRRRRFAPGSMAPKVEAACRFAEQTGGVAAIGALDQAAALLEGGAGTRVERGREAG